MTTNVIGSSIGTSAPLPAGAIYAVVAGDGKTVTDAAITVGTALLSSTSAAFTQADVDKLVVVTGAGTPPAVGTLSGAITGTITSIPVNALAAAVPAGPVTVVYPGGATPYNQTFVTTGAAQGATSIPVNSEGVSGTLPGGSAIFTPFAHLYATILSVSAGVATLSTNALNTVSGAEVTYGTDDTAQVQAAVTLAQAIGGKAIFAKGQICMTTNPVVTSATGTLWIAGQGCFELYGSANSDLNAVNFPAVAPYLTGTVFVVMSPATDAFQLKGVGVAQDLSDFGIRFAGAFSNTGNGVNATPTTTTDLGLLGHKWENIKVYGHDGNHYAYVETNQLYPTMTHIRSWGGGGQNIYCNAGGLVVCGNVVQDHPYHQVIVYGTANGITIHAPSSFLNLMTFIRPQVGISVINPVITGVCVPYGQSNLFSDTGSSVTRVCFIAPDFEYNPSTFATSTFPTVGCEIVGGGTYNPNLTNNPTFAGATVSGTTYTNNSGSAQIVNMSFTMNPTGGAAATVVISVGGQTVGQLESPAGATPGEILSIVAVVPSGYGLKYIATNATIANFYGNRIAGG
jgi:hypothetical protein